MNAYRIWYRYENTRDEECIDFFVISAVNKDDAEARGREQLGKEQYFDHVE